MYLPLNLRIRLARRHAIRFQAQHGGVDMTNPVVPTELIQEQLGSRVIVDCSEGFIVTEAGFITMALLPKDARYCQGSLVIPGLDDRNQFGYLVLREGFAPYHSLATSIGRATVDAQRSREKASKLVQHFGGKTELREAAASTPWYFMSRIEDAASAGLCQWGTTSFLRRAGLLKISEVLGLPRIIVRLPGNYGYRITAATLVRRELRLSMATRPQE